MFGDADRNIPVETHRAMAERAGSKGTVELPGASHALTVSRPDEVADVRRRAGRAGFSLSSVADSAGMQPYRQPVD